VEKSHSVGAEAEPAHGHYRPNPALGVGTRRVARLALERASGGMAVRSDLQGRLAVEGGEGDTDWLRATVEGRWLTGAGPGELLTRVYAGAGTDDLPGYRSFVLGGRGTLMTEPFRAYGGRSMALAQVEWRLDVPAPAVPLGSFASTGHRMTVAPFLAAGWAERPPAGLPWTDSDGVRPVAGVAFEWFMRLLRVETGVGLRDGRVGITVDINRDWWGVL
jgi:outer membrane protein assembly factor BamA